MKKAARRARKQKATHTNVLRPGGRSEAQDSNIFELLPSSKTDKAKRQRQLKAAGAASPKISKKKQKRLETYIAKKLRKDENTALIDKLAHAKVDTSLLKSTRSLGNIRETWQERRSRLEKERQAGLAEDSSDASLKHENKERKVHAEDEAVLAYGRDTPVRQTETSVTENAVSTKVNKFAIVFGTGLKRSLDVDENGNPMIPRKKQRRKAARSGFEPAREWQRAATADETIDKNDHHALLREGDQLEEAHDSQSSASKGNETSSGSVISSDEEDQVESTSISQHSSGSDLESASGEDEGHDPKKSSTRISAFKAWAEQVRNESLGFTPSRLTLEGPTNCGVGNVAFQNLSWRPDQEDMPDELKHNASRREIFNVTVERNPEIQNHRLALPIVMEEHRIMEAIHSHSTVLICAATGSGKTTQIPQFFFESGYGSPESPNPGIIGVTQPRRVAAVSMARRVATELGPYSDRVAYKIRFESSVKEKTSIKFMTDGILLREVSDDILLRKYSAVVLDEAHEMSKDTSILIGMMSKIVKLRERLAVEDPTIRPLKLIIMSATPTFTDIIQNKRLFPNPPPVVQIEGRQYPVTVHWARRTTHDYLEESYRKVVKAHRSLPPGGMLVFLTGQNEILDLSKRLEETFHVPGSGQNLTKPTVHVSGKEVPMETEDVEIDYSDAEKDVLNFEATSSIDSNSNFGFHSQSRTDTIDEDITPTHILPLYSLLPTSEQLRVFDPPPEGSRLIVLSTNIAETSLTIPGIRYVFDCGRAKERKYNDETGVQTFEVTWISKASANQRAGRAGRTGPGHCYRLYSSAVYERDFRDSTEPEIQRTPLEGVVLQLVGLGVPNILSKFPFPTAPDPLRLRKATNLLRYLGAMSKSDQLTELGRKMAVFPLMPRFSKILLNDDSHHCLPHTIVMVAALSIPDIFVPVESLANALPVEIPFCEKGTFLDKTNDAGRRHYFKAQSRFSQQAANSDALKLLAAVLAHEASVDPATLCAETFLRPKAIREVHMVRRQLTNILRADPLYANMLRPTDGPLPFPSAKQVKYLKEVVAAGFIDQVAIRADLAPIPPDQPRKPKRAAAVPYLPLFPPTAHHADEKTVYIHPSSVLSRSPLEQLPPYIVYWKLQRSANSSIVRMHPLTPISSAQLAALTFGTPLQEMGKPIKEVTMSDKDGLKRVRWVVPMLRGSAGTQGWPLPARKVVQRKTHGTWIDES